MFRIMLLFAMLSFIFPTIYCQQILVIVNNENKLSKIDKENVKKIFLGKTRFFPNGDRAVPYDQPSNNSTRKLFTKTEYPL